jgi:hypothetical protein
MGHFPGWERSTRERVRAIAKPTKNGIVRGHGYEIACMQKRASAIGALVRLVACAALGLVISAGLTVASTRRGGIAVNGQVGAELPPGGVRSLVVGQGLPVVPTGNV